MFQDISFKQIPGDASSIPSMISKMTPSIHLSLAFHWTLPWIPEGTPFLIKPPKYKPQVPARLIPLFFPSLPGPWSTTLSHLKVFSQLCFHFLWHVIDFYPAGSQDPPMGPSSGYSDTACLHHTRKKLNSFQFFLYKYKLRNNMFPWNYYIFRSSWRSCLENTSINSYIPNVLRNYKITYFHDWLAIFKAMSNTYITKKPTFTIEKKTLKRWSDNMSSDTKTTQSQMIVRLQKSLLHIEFIVSPYAQLITVDRILEEKNLN